MLNEDLTIIIDGRKIDRFIPFFKLVQIALEERNRRVRKGNAELCSEFSKRFFELNVVVFHVEQLRETIAGVKNVLQKEDHLARMSLRNRFALLTNSRLPAVALDCYQQERNCGRRDTRNSRGLPNGSRSNTLEFFPHLT